MKRRYILFVLLGLALLPLEACRNGGATADELTEYGGQKLDPISSFPALSIKGTPHIDPGNYRLAVTGLVENPLSLGLEELEKFPHVDVVTPLHCVTGWSATALWTGIPLRDLIAKAGPKPGAATVILQAADGYTTSLPLDFVMQHGDVILADRMNGVVLPPEHGFPLRLVVPGKWGYKWIKWVVEIELSSDTGYRGFWESRGYSNDASVDKPPYEGGSP